VNSSSIKTNNRLNSLLWAIIAGEGLLATAVSLRIQSETGSAFMFGYSRSRLFISALALAGCILAAVFAWAATRRPGWWQKLAGAASRLVSPQWRRSLVFICMYVIFTGVLSLLILSVSPAALEIVALKSMLARVGFLLVWFELTLIEIFTLQIVNDRRVSFSPVLMALLVSITSLIYFVVLHCYATTTWMIRFRGMERYIFLPAAVCLVWASVHAAFSTRPWYPRVSRLFLLVLIGVATYCLYFHTAQWMEWQNTPNKSYWPDLANAFLQGHLWIANPDTTHDLTFFNGHWFVPNPPLPVFFFLPLVALYGTTGVNTVTFSILFGALNVTLVYVLLKRASQAGLIPTRRTANLWLTTVFALGTCYWWLAIMGRMWFISQVFTVLFTTIAVLMALRKASPWWIGASLGVAVLARPNIFTVWPLLAGIYLYLNQKQGLPFSWRRLISWTICTAIPLAAAAAGLLYYNHIRFGNWLDFGYVDITSAEFITQAVQTYGIFNLHFFPINLNAMFLKLPLITYQKGCLTYSPTREGLSILAMTPAAIYIFRRFKFNYWTAGAWASVIISAGLLLLYHNTGAWQLGYRYLMDFILPVLLLMALGIGEKPSWAFKSLAALSLLGNAAGILWWFNKWPC
jgi:hypothetical protein